jgi:hypothetical protein
MAGSTERDSCALTNDNSEEGSREISGIAGDRGSPRSHHGNPEDRCAYEERQGLPGIFHRKRMEEVEELLSSSHLISNEDWPAEFHMTLAAIQILYNRMRVSGAQCRE